MKTIRIYSRLVKLEGGRTFFSYSLKKGNEYYNVKGTKDCTGLPVEKGYFKVTGEDNAFSIQNKSASNKYSTIWIRGHVTAVRDVDYEAKQSALKQAEIDSVINDQLFD